MKLPHFPKYSELGAFLSIITEIKVDKLRNLFVAITDLIGTPQNPVKWDNPDEWIDQRLAGDNQMLAKYIWEKSNKQVNPRYARRVYWPVNTYVLAKENPNGFFELTTEGTQFLQLNEPQIIQHIDREEGLVTILSLVSSSGAVRPKDLEEDWKVFCLERSNIRGQGVMRTYLHRRISNLLDRGYLTRDGGKYSISSEGTNYLKKVKSQTTDYVRDETEELLQLIKDFSNKQRESLKKQLENMDPYAFEELIKELLEAMNYEEVEVTTPSNDKGVDVKGIVQIGITTVVEVVQVKRVKGNIQRPVLDMLRGSLHRFNALRGTIITTGDFSKGVREASTEIGAAPITLINGDKLVELLIEYGVGVQKAETSYFVVNLERFKQDSTTLS